MRRIWVVTALWIAALGAPAVPLTATAAPAVTASSPSHIDPCFGNLGIQFDTKDAYLCEVKLGNNPSGALYFSPSLDNGVDGPACNNPPNCPQMVWYKLHPAKGNFYAWENMSPEWGGSSHADGRVIALDEGPNGQCLVPWPSWTTDPTECLPWKDGGAVIGPLRPLTQQEKDTIAQYQINARAAIPLEYR